MRSRNVLLSLEPTLLLVTSCRLLAFVVLLALANLGTSFASAILAKDTTTANGELVDVKTNEAVATGQAVTVFTVGADDGENARKLPVCTVDNDKSTKNICDVNAGAGFTTISNGNALAMPKDCMAGSKRVQLRHVTGRGNNIQVNTKMVCGSGICGGSTFELTNNEPTSGLLCTADPNQKLLVKSSSTDTYSLLTVSAACFTDAECGDSSLFCNLPPQIAYGMMPAEPCNEDRDCSDYGGVCYQGVCGSCSDSIGCDPSSEYSECISTGGPNRCGCSSDSCRGGKTCAVPSCISGGDPICHVAGQYPSCQGTCEFNQQV